MTSPLMIIIPGQLPVTNFVPTSSTQLMADVPFLAPQICVSLIEANCVGVLNPQDGIGIYVTDFQPESYVSAGNNVYNNSINPAAVAAMAAASATGGNANYHFLGYVSYEQPSIQVKLPAVMSLTTLARFGCSLESVATLKNISSATNSGSVGSLGGASRAAVAPAPTPSRAAGTASNGLWGAYSGYYNDSPLSQQAPPFPTVDTTTPLSAKNSPTAIRIGKAILETLYTFLTSFSKTFSPDQPEAIYLPTDWEQRWYNKFISKRDNGAYTGEDGN